MHEHGAKAHEHGEKAHEHGGRGSGAFVDTQKVIDALVKEGDIFLDVGCGPGDYLEAAEAKAGTVIGIDLHAPSIEKVNARGFRGMLADAAKHIPLQDASVDAVLLSNVLHGFVANGEAPPAIAEIARVLRRGGRLGIVEFTMQSAFGPLVAIRLTPSMIDSLLFAKGFSRIGELSVGKSNFLSLYSKDAAEE